MKTKGLYPERVFYFFEKISEIPRGSKKEKKISDWIVKFAKENKLEVFQDENLNVIIKKPGTNGYQSLSPFIIQGHMDMVWEKNRETNFDFENQGIDLIVDGNIIKANNTTLGADNGIAVAYALALLESKDIEHPPLEVLITTDEEAGMSGVNNLDVALLKGHTLLNIDTEDFGEIYVSSAGGSRIKNILKFKTSEIIDSNIKNSIFTINITGLRGGHSGTDINKNLGNANKILGDILYHISKKYSFNLIDFNGGDKNNAIPREASSTINVDLSISNDEDFKILVTDAANIFKSTYFKDDDNLSIEINKSDNIYTNQLNLSDSMKFIQFLHNLPNGVISMSKSIENLVETSINIGVVKTVNVNNQIDIIIESLLRSSVDSNLKNLENSIFVLSEDYGIEYQIDSTYSPWEYNKNSKLRILFEDAFKKITSKNPKIMAIHAGLECGILVSKIRNLDVISIGPNIRLAHTPSEYMEIDSVGKTWDVILEVLKTYNIED